MKKNALPKIGLPKHYTEAQKLILELNGIKELKVVKKHSGLHLWAIIMSFPQKPCKRLVNNVRTNFPHRCYIRLFSHDN